MPDLQTLFASGRIIDVILALMVLEALILFAIWRRTGRGLSGKALVANLFAGAALMLALRSALIGAPWMTTASWLIAALAAHAADLYVRWAQKPDRSG